MSAIKKTALYTFEDFCELIRHGQKADLIGGVIYMASPDNTDANTLNVWLVSVLNLFVEDGDLGKVYVSRVAYRLSDRDGPEPDIGFVRKDRLHLVKRGHVAGPPNLAIEIVSPDSIDRDYLTKRAQYEKAGVEEYWIIDELRRKLTVLRLGPQGRYREVRPVRGIFRSRVLPGFWLRVSWLWEEPLPPVLNVFQEITGRRI